MPFAIRHRLWTLLVALLVLSCASGCQAPPLDKLAGAAQAETKTAETPAEAPVAMELEIVEEARDEIPRAKRLLARRYATFLSREPLGFGIATIDHVGPELSRVWARTTGNVASVGSGSVRNTGPIVVVGLLLLVLALLDRQTMRVAMRLQATVRWASWRWVTTWVRLGVIVAGRCAPVLFVVGLSYFPVQAVFDSADWSVAITSLLWLLLAYRALRTGSQAMLALGLLRVPDLHGDRLERFARRALRWTFVLYALVVVAGVFEVADDVRALIVFVYEVALLGIPVYLLFMKPSVMALFPEPEDSAAYAKVRSAVERYFRLIVVLSLLLLGLRAAGYVNASTFILVRGYGLLALVVLVLGGGTRLRRWFRARGQHASADEQDLYKSVEWAIRVTSMLFLLYTGLRLAELLEPIIVVLTIPIVSFGAAMISTYSILKALLFFLVAILIARFVRAVLVLRIFPAFGIDVGVGYAVQTLVNYAFICIGFFVALVALGVNLSAMTVVVASLGVGIGFGLQTLTENLISGFILLFGQSVKKGDIITVGDHYGHVQAVGARSVIIKTTDNFDMLIPSKEIVGGRIINWSYENTLIRQKLPVGVSYNAKPREVERILIEAALKHPEVMADPRPEVWLKGFGDNAVDFILLVWFDCRKITRDRLAGQLYFHIWDGLEAAGIEIPFPQRDVHLKSIDFADELRKRS